MKILFSFIFSLIFFLLVSCNEKGTNPEDGPEGYSITSGRCGQVFLKESDIQDSSFVYIFSDDLLIDFSVRGNCCPDSNRFTVAHRISYDTIYISVDDTAAHLCRCMCDYHIYAEFNDLPEDHYAVVCTLEGAYNNPIHIVDCYRMNLLISEETVAVKRGK